MEAIDTSTPAPPGVVSTPTAAPVEPPSFEIRPEGSELTTFVNDRLALEAEYAAIMAGCTPTPGHPYGDNPSLIGLVSHLGRAGIQHRRDRNIASLIKQMKELEDGLAHLRTSGKRLPAVPEPSRVLGPWDKVMLEAVKVSRESSLEFQWKRQVAAKLADESSRRNELLIQSLEEKSWELEKIEKCALVAEEVKVFFAEVGELWEAAFDVCSTPVQVVGRAPKIKYTSLDEIVDILENLFSLSPKISIPLTIAAQGDLRDFQHLGLDWLVKLHSTGLNGILADSRGLGKKVMVLALYSWLLEQSQGWHGKFLIVAPEETLLEWQIEAMKWSPQLPCLRITGTDKTIGEACIYFATATDLENAEINRSSAFDKRWGYVVLDEGEEQGRVYDSNFAKRALNLRCDHRLLVLRSPLPPQEDAIRTRCLLRYALPDGIREDMPDVYSMTTLLTAHTLQRGYDLVKEEVQNLSEATVDCLLSETQLEMAKGIPESACTPRIAIRRAYALRRIINTPFTSPLPEVLSSELCLKLETLHATLDSLTGSTHRVAVFAQNSFTLQCLSKYLSANNFNVIDMYKLTSAFLDTSAGFHLSIRGIRNQLEEQCSAGSPVFLFPTRGAGLGLSLVKPTSFIIYESEVHPVCELLLRKRLISCALMSPLGTPVELLTLSTPQEQILSAVTLDPSSQFDFLAQYETYFASESFPGLPGLTLQQLAVSEELPEDRSQLLNMLRHQLGVPQRYLDVFNGVVVGHSPYIGRNLSLANRTQGYFSKRKTRKLLQYVAWSLQESKGWTAMNESEELVRFKSSLTAKKSEFTEQIEQLKATIKVPESIAPGVEVSGSEVAVPVIPKEPVLFLNYTPMSSANRIKKFARAHNLKVLPSPEESTVSTVEQFSACRKSALDEDWGLLVTSEDIDRATRIRERKPLLKFVGGSTRMVFKKVKVRSRPKSRGKENIRNIRVKIAWTKLPPSFKIARDQRKATIAMNSAVYGSVGKALSNVMGTIDPSQCRPFNAEVPFLPSEDELIKQEVVLVGTQWHLVALKLLMHPLCSGRYRTKEQLVERYAKLTSVPEPKEDEKDYDAMKVDLVDTNNKAKATRITKIASLMDSIVSQQTSSFASIRSGIEYASLAAPHASHNKTLERGHRRLNVPTELLGQTLSPKRLVDLRILREGPSRMVCCLLHRID